MKLLNYVPAVLTICLIVGILLGYFYNFNYWLLFIVTAICLLLLITTYYRENNIVNSSYTFQLLSYLLFVIIGIISITIQNDSVKETHYSNYIKPFKNNIYIKINKHLKQTIFGDKYEAEILQINNKKSFGKILLNIKKDSVNIQYKPGDIYYTKTILKPINKPKNPFEFDYNKYLKSKQVEHQIYTKKEKLFYIKFKSNINRFTNAVINKINVKLKKTGVKKDELAIINALLLGQRQNISKEIITSYQNAGAIHILAVSGLHIGIIFGILLIIFYPFKLIFYKNNKGQMFQYALAIIFVWLYALLAGLSSSVVRSATMFTVLAVGFLSNRKSHTINNLFISAFILLLIHPQFLFDIGFQLSYLAVFSIIYWNPVFNKIWNPKNKLVRVFWTVFTISISAQIGILPLSLLYFHQFPVLFFVSGLVVIPVLGFLLAYGFFTITLAYFDLLPNLIAKGLFYCIKLLNFFITKVASQEQFIIKQIYFSILLTLASYLIIISVYQLINKFLYNKLVFVLVTILIFQGVLFYHKLLRESKKEWIVFNKNKKTIIGVRNGNNLTIYHNLDSIKNDFAVQNYKVGTGISTITEKISIQNYYTFNSHKILVIDSLGVYNISNFKKEIILLIKSPKINIERVINQLQPKLIIADGSNFSSYTNYYKQKCSELNIPFYNTKQKGAFVLKR
jgi:competence protein ComEC